MGLRPEIPLEETHNIHYVKYRFGPFRPQPLPDPTWAHIWPQTSPNGSREIVPALNQWYLLEIVVVSYDRKAKA